MYGKTVSKEAESRREQCSTELGRQLEIVVGSFANGIAQYCVQLADMLRSDHAQLKQQLTKQLAHYQSACSAVGGVQNMESMLRQLSDLYQQLAKDAWNCSLRSAPSILSSLLRSERVFNIFWFNSLLVQ